jgi:hypothetical protein
MELIAKMEVNLIAKCRNEESQKEEVQVFRDFIPETSQGFDIKLPKHQIPSLSGFPIFWLSRLIFIPFSRFL